MKDSNKRPSMQSYEKGFTLIEILVAIAISGIVMAGIYSAYYSQQQSYRVQEQVAVAQQNIRAAMYLMEKEIRMAGCDPKGSADAGIGTAQTSTISFTEDIGDGAGGDPNGIIEDPSENITYTLNGTDLERNDQVVAQDVQALSFIYFDEDGNATAIPEDVRSVQISMTAGTGSSQRNMTTRVKCRNLGFEKAEENI